MLAKLLREASAPAAVPEIVYRDSRAMAVDTAALSRSGLNFGTKQAATPQDFLDLYGSLVVVYRCVTLNARSVAQAVLRFYRSVGDDDERDELPWDHPIQELFRHPNPLMSGRGWVFRIMMQKQLTGNSFSEVVRSGNADRSKASREWALIRAQAVERRPKLPPVQQIWPMSSAHMRPERDPKVGVKRWLYGQGIDPVKFEPEEVFHDLYPDPQDPVMGLSPLRASARTVVSDELLERATNTMLRNGVRLSGILNVEPDMPPENQEHIQQQLTALYAGVENWGKNMVVPGGRKFDQLSMTPVEFEALTTRKWNREQLLETYGVWPIIYGIMDTSATRENATTQRKLYQELTVDAEADALQSEMNEKLIPYLGLPDCEDVFCEFDFSGTALAKELAWDEARSNSALADKGILTINEIRAVSGYDPVEWGDTWWGPANIVDISGGYGEEPVATDLPPQEEPAGKKKIDVTQDTVLNGAPIQAALAIVQAVADGLLPRDSGKGQLMVLFNLTEAQAEQMLGSVGAGWVQPKPEAPVPPEPPPTPARNAQERDYRRVRAELEALVREFDPDQPRDEPAHDGGLGEQLSAKTGETAEAHGDGLVAKSSSSRAGRVAGAGKLPDGDRLFKAAQSLLHAAFGDAGREASARVGGPFNPDLPEYAEAMRAKTVQFADFTWNTTSSALTESLAQGMEANESIDQLAARVEAVFDGRRGDAETVARTEVTSAMSRGTLAAFAEAGVERHAWITQRDEGVRDSHADIDGDIVDVGEEFDNGLLYPGDMDSTGNPEDYVNCRCVLYPVTGDEKAMTEESKAAVWRSAERTAVGHRRAFASLFTRILAKQRGLVLRELRPRRGGN